MMVDQPIPGTAVKQQCQETLLLQCIHGTATQCGI